MSHLLDSSVGDHRRSFAHHGRLGLQPQLIDPHAKVPEEASENLREERCLAQSFVNVIRNPPHLADELLGTFGLGAHPPLRLFRAERVSGEDRVEVRVDGDEGEGRPDAIWEKFQICCLIKSSVKYSTIKI